MKTFPGFPDKVQYRALPATFFRDILPHITDLAELKASLYALALISQKGGYPRAVTLEELGAWWRGERGDGEDAGQALRHGLELAVQRGTLLHRAVERGNGREDLYTMNTLRDAQALVQLPSGELSSSPVLPPAQPPHEPVVIFTLYEENIGIITPLVAEELMEAERSYPAEWIQDAFKEAVTRNRRNWRYISKILERWAAEGRGDGETGRHPKKIDPDKYIKGRYGHLVQR